jgi:hypothetical protein
MQMHHRVQLFRATMTLAASGRAYYPALFIDYRKYFLQIVHILLLKEKTRSFYVYSRDFQRLLFS